MRRAAASTFRASFSRTGLAFDLATLYDLRDLVAECVTDEPDDDIADDPWPAN